MTLNRPEKINAWNEQLVSDMLSCLEDFKNDENMHVVIVKGAGKHFSAGMDFAAVTDKPGEEILRFFKKCMSVRDVLQSMHQITIAAVQGVATAFGIHIAWFCDLAIASEDASIGAPPINIGIG
jgi:enoyl-CoA hydratase/carnithine racemase